MTRSLSTILPQRKDRKVDLEHAAKEPPPSSLGGFFSSLSLMALHLEEALFRKLSCPWEFVSCFGFSLPTRGQWV